MKMCKDVHLTPVCLSVVCNILFCDTDSITYCSRNPRMVVGIVIHAIVKAIASFLDVGGGNEH